MHRNPGGRTTPWASAVAALRDADWLTAERARAWCRVLAAVSAVTSIVWIVLARDGVDRLGKPLGTDFVGFWVAAHMTLEGRIGSVYDVAAEVAGQHALFPGAAAGFYPFFYPPIFLLLCLPFAALPYFTALVAWLTAGFIPFFASLRRLLPQRWAILPILAYPGILVNAGHGQNGFFSGACLGGTLLLLERRPFLAGTCLGALVFKPHLALAAPVVFIAARRWRAVAGAASSSLGLVALSWLALGGDAWQGFLQAASVARTTLEEGWLEPGKMQSVFSAVRVLHGGLGLAYGLHALVALAACALAAWVAARRPGAQAEGAVLIAATLLCSPYLLDYDLACLALPLAWIMAQASRTEWRPWEKIALLAAYALPLIGRVLAVEIALPLGPPVLIAVLLVVARRVAQAANDGASPIRPARKTD
jgi:alpha-1,2-mannosyltransferase